MTTSPQTSPVRPADLTVAFPRSGRPVSRLGFGGAAIGLTNYLSPYDAASPAQRELSVEALRRAADGGVTYFDTAPGYGQGLSESIFGEALAGRDVTIATKVPTQAGSDVRASLEGSLRRLRRDRVDLLQIHGTSYTDETLTQILATGGLLDQMVRLRDEGLVGAIGFTSEDNNPPVYALIRTGAFDVMQIAYNLILQHPFEPTRPFGSLFEAKEHGLFTVAMRTMTSGIFQRWIRMANPADTFDYAPALLQFCLSNPLLDVALVGMRSDHDVTASIATWRDTAGRIDLDALWTRYVEEPTPRSAR